MAPLIKLRLGNLFDGPSDLIVLPCSTNGTITGFVAAALSDYKIPYPKNSYKLGDVDIRPFEGGENIAQFVAFAASVGHMASTEEAIRSIGNQLGAATLEYSSIKAVSTPLLGAGAGGLNSEKVVASLEEGFKSSAHKDAILTISILHENVFNRLKDQANATQALTHSEESRIKVPRVFISYTGMNPNLKEWVVSFATYLRNNGIEARLDQWHLRKGMDLPQWMMNELQMADRVIIISDAKYKDKADGRLGGVAWETMIIQNDYLQNTTTNKYLLIVREQDLDSGTPKYLKGKLSVHWPPIVDNDQNELLQKDLLKDLYNVDLAPPIGKPPIWI
jgi:hypothetical protein